MASKIIVRNTVHDRIGKCALAATDLLIPFLFLELGAEDRGRFLLTFMDQLKQISGLRLSEFQKKPLIDDQQNWLCVLLQCTGKVSIVPGGLQIRKTDILDRVVLFTGFHTECTGHICFSASGRASNKDVPVLCDVFAVRHAFDRKSSNMRTRN